APAPPPPPRVPRPPRRQQVHHLPPPGPHSSSSLPPGSITSPNLPPGPSSRRSSTRAPRARSFASSPSRSSTRKFTMNSRSLGSKYFVSARNALHTPYVFADVDQNCAPPHSWISIPSISRYHALNASTPFALTNTPPIPSPLAIPPQPTGLLPRPSIIAAIRVQPARSAAAGDVGDVGERPHPSVTSAVDADPTSLRPA